MNNTCVEQCVVECLTTVERSKKGGTLGWTQTQTYGRPTAQIASDTDSTLGYKALMNTRPVI